MSMCPYVHMYDISCLCVSAFKVKGNEAFAQGDYEAAVQQYTAGLNALRDMEVLYTNRAQVHDLHKHWIGRAQVKHR